MLVFPTKNSFTLARSTRTRACLCAVCAYVATDLIAIDCSFFSVSNKPCTQCIPEVILTCCERLCSQVGTSSNSKIKQLKFFGSNKPYKRAHQWNATRHKIYNIKTNDECGPTTITHT